MVWLFWVWTGCFYWYRFVYFDLTLSRSVFHRNFCRKLTNLSTSRYLQRPIVKLYKKKMLKSKKKINVSSTLKKYLKSLNQARSNQLFNNDEIPKLPMLNTFAQSRWKINLKSHVELTLIDMLKSKNVF